MSLNNEQNIYHFHSPYNQMFRNNAVTYISATHTFYPNSYSFITVDRSGPNTLERSYECAGIYIGGTLFIPWHWIRLRNDERGI